MSETVNLLAEVVKRELDRLQLEFGQVDDWTRTNTPKSVAPIVADV